MALEFDVKRLKGDVPVAKSPGRPPKDYVKELALVRRNPGKPYVVATCAKPADAAAAVGSITRGLYRAGVLGFDVASRTIDGVPTVIATFNGEAVVKAKPTPKKAAKPVVKAEAEVPVPELATV